MICRRCRRDNATNSQYCRYCGAPLSMKDINSSKKQKQSESVIVAVIIILVLVLLMLAGTGIYRNGRPRKTGFGTGGGGGGGFLPSQTSIVTNTVAPTQPPMPTPTGIGNIVTPQPTAPQKTQEPVVSESLIKKTAFQKRAEEIELYAEENLATAMSQYDINNESAIVFEKWDTLLNDVYQYLKDTLPYNEFENLEADEVEWIIEKEAAIEAAAVEWEGGSGEAMVRNLTAIQYTEDRCYYLISLIN